LPSGSNPRGYALWFEDINKAAFVRFEASQRKAIVEKYASIYASVETVPDALIRTPLQRAIQILKRHRDIYFKDNPKVKPISMIVTTLATKAYNGETEIYTALTNIVNKLTNYDTSMLIGHIDGEWWIPNPVNPAENFADRWHENNHACARAFFEWLSKLKKDFDTASREIDLQKISETLSASFGEKIVEKTFEKFNVSAKPKIPNVIISPSLREFSPRTKPWGRY
jgi:hypothetical protein